MRKTKVDENALRGKIREIYGDKGGQAAFAKDLGMTVTTLSKKLNGYSEFSWGDLIDMAKLLQVSNDAYELKRIFFTQTI